MRVAAKRHEMIIKVRVMCEWQRQKDSLGCEKQEISGYTRLGPHSLWRSEGALCPKEADLGGSQQGFSIRHVKLTFLFLCGNTSLELAHKSGVQGESWSGDVTWGDKQVDISIDGTTRMHLMVGVEGCKDWAQEDVDS